MIEMIKKSVDFKSTILKDDNDYFYFEGYASTFGNLDRGRDVVLNGAFKDSLNDSMPVMLYQHDPNQVIGVYEEANEDDKGLYVRGKMPKSHSLAKDVYSLLKLGAIKSMSIGFTIDESELKEEENIRFLKKLTLWEISLVTFPMNPKAEITSVKSINDLSTMRDIEQYLRKTYKIGKKERRAIIAKIKSFNDRCDAAPSDVIRRCDAAGETTSKHLTSINQKLDEILKNINPGV